ncbi:MAG: hypothetical protein K8R23_16870 [Chthoniobacter sp.]|nr:hypothetical protein [Chthoniobacter sp.]
MGARLQIGVFRECDRSRFELALETVAKELGVRITLDEAPSPPAKDCRTAHAQGVQSIYLPYLSGVEHQLITGLGRKLDCAWMMLYLQEGSIWEYRLYRADRCLDNFSVAPQYWTDSKEFTAQRRGNPRLLSETWGTPVEELQRYIADWQMRDIDDDTFEFALKGKAYPHDRSDYGAPNQVFDFLQALGGMDPLNILAGARQHALYLPGCQ